MEMKKINIDIINEKLITMGRSPIILERDTYPEIRINKEGTSLVDQYGNPIGTKGDMYQKLFIEQILTNIERSLDIDPRPRYKSDGVPAHSISLNHGAFNKVVTYDLTKGESPLLTLQPTAFKTATGEILWIYQEQSNDLSILRDKYGVKWWDDWDIGDGTIGMTYGAIIKRHDLVNKLLNGIIANPDGRRHMIDMWQEEDYSEKHGLRPCAFLTNWNVRHGEDGVDYLDLMLTQRSSDFQVAGAVNQTQYVVLQYMFARHLGLTPGRFTWSFDNVQIYDRHVNQAIELLNREPVNCNPHIELNDNVVNFYDFKVDDVKLVNYPRDEIKEKNKKLTYELAV